MWRVPIVPAKNGLRRVCMSKYAPLGRSEPVTNVEIVAGAEASAGEAITGPRITPLWMEQREAAWCAGALLRLGPHRSVVTRSFAEYYHYCGS